MTRTSKIQKAFKGIRERGFIGYFRYFFFESEHNFIGRIVELLGNRVYIEGMRIDVNNPVLSLVDKCLCLQQRFEQPERAAIKLYLDRSLPVIELGGSIGVVACMTNQLLDDPGQHIVVEAHPLLAKTLKKNRDHNNCQFTILNKAVAYGEKTITFYEYGISSGIKDSAEAVAGNQYELGTISLGAILEQFQFKSFSLVCDIEGAEEDLIACESELLANHVKHIFIELHPDTTSSESVEETITSLQRVGFKQIWRENNVYVFVNEHLPNN